MSSNYKHTFCEPYYASKNRHFMFCKLLFSILDDTQKSEKEMANFSLVKSISLDALKMASALETFLNISVCNSNSHLYI